MNHDDLSNIVKIYQTKHPDEIFIEASITNACELNCKYCINQEVGAGKPKKFLCLKKLRETAVYLNKTYFKSIAMEITGGEPTMHPQLAQFCNTCDWIREIGIITNLTRDIEYYEKLLQHNNVKLYASFHYIDSEQTRIFIEKISQLHEKFRQKIANVFIMLACEKFEECTEVYRLLKNIGIKTYGCKIYPNGRYTSEYTVNQTEQMKKMLREHEDVYTETNDGRVAKLDFFDVTDNIDFRHWKCDAGLNQLYIDVDGNVYPCKNIKNRICSIDNIRAASIKPVICPYSGQCTEEVVYREKIFR